MKKYIIKVTYLEGIHAGKEYYLNKQGFVVDNFGSIWQDSSYTERGCKTACAKLEKNNNAEAAAEKAEREWNIAAGRKVSNYPIYVRSKYEPFAIETVDA